MTKSLQQLMSMHGRVSLVTGAAGHIGRTIAETLCELGATVVLLDLDEPALRQLAGELEERYGTRALALASDLEHEARQRDLAGFVRRECGRLDVLVNNAAFVGASDLEGWNAAFRDQSAATWRRALEVNLTAPFRLAQHCADLLAESGHGAIVNIGSIYGVFGPDLGLYAGTDMHNPAAYAASKGGLLQLTRWMATCLAPAIRVNAISPGGLERGQPESFVQRYEARTPLGRMASCEDLKGAIAFFCSDLSAYVTGENLLVDGGWGAW